MVDPKSYELAEYFLADFAGITHAQRLELAQVIQDAIEDWIIPQEQAGVLVEAE